MALASVGVTVTDTDNGLDEILREVDSMDGAFVEVGLFGKNDSEQVIIGAANHFGATINHPGGTPFGFRTTRDIKKNKIRFLKKGQGAVVLGVTPPHQIRIPPRPFITAAVDENQNKYGKLSERIGRQIVTQNLTKDRALRVVGEIIKADIQRKITRGPFTPNAPSTLRQKAPKNKPLINTGRLRQSIVYAVGKDDETDESEFFS